MGGGENTPPVPELALLGLRFAISEPSSSSLLRSEPFAYIKYDCLIILLCHNHH